jgi:adenosylcobinamide-GDP ribazoletransferase
MTEPASDFVDAKPGLWAELCLASSFLTCLRIDLAPTVAALPLAASVRAFALTGAGVGLAGAIVYAAAATVGLAPAIAALLAIGSAILLTGALHEDGLADFADASGAATAERRLAIMRDSRIGTFGVLALILSVGLRAAALASLADPVAVAPAMIAAAAASRAAMVYPMHILPFARPDGLARVAGRPSAARLRDALFLGALFLLPLGLAGAALAALFASAAVWYITRRARRLLGGQTGDVLGAIQQTAETAVLLAAAMAIGLSEG